MYQKFWKQFLTEQNAQATYNLEPDSRELARDVPSTRPLPTMPQDEPVAREPQEQTGLRAFLESKGLRRKQK